MGFSAAMWWLNVWEECITCILSKCLYWFKVDVELLRSKKWVFHIPWFQDEGVGPLTAMEVREGIGLS